MFENKIKTSRTLVLISSLILVVQGALFGIFGLLLSSVDSLFNGSFDLFGVVNPGALISYHASYTLILIFFAAIYVLLGYFLYKLYRDSNDVTFISQKWIFFAIGCFFLVFSAGLLSVITGLSLVATFALIISNEYDKDKVDKTSENNDSKVENKTINDEQTNNTSTEDLTKTVTFYPKK